MDLDSGLNQILKDINSLPRRQILIGIQEDSQTKAQSKNGRKQKQGVSIAQYAAANEFGTEKIPQRSFMRSTFDEKLPDIMRVINSSFGRVVDRKIPPIKAYREIGQAVEGFVKMKIHQIMSPPNSPVTIELKKSSKPLIDFGQMVAAVRYIIVRELNNGQSQ